MRLCVSAFSAFFRSSVAPLYQLWKLLSVSFVERNRILQRKRGDAEFAETQRVELLASTPTNLPLSRE